MLRFVIEQQNQRLVRSTKDAVVDVLPKASPELVVMPLNSINDVILIEASTLLEAIVEGVEETHSPSPSYDERNHEYLIRLAAFGENPIQEEMRADAA